MRQARETLTACGRIWILTLFCALMVSLTMLAAQRPATAQGTAYSSCNNPLVLVDRQHGFSPGYVPPDLYYLSYFGVPTTGGGQLLRYDAATALSGMVSDANAAGVELTVSSAWRSTTPRPPSTTTGPASTAPEQEG